MRIKWVDDDDDLSIEEDGCRLNIYTVDMLNDPNRLCIYWCDTDERESEMILSGDDTIEALKQLRNFVNDRLFELQAQPA